MDVPVCVGRGVEELRRLLGERTFDLRTLDPAGFRRWLGEQRARWQNDPVFVQRVRIRDLRRAHSELRRLEKEYRRAAQADAAAPQSARLNELDQELSDTGKAIAGLTAALGKRPALLEKLRTYQAREQALREERAMLVQSSPERQALLQIGDELQRLRSATGLDHEEQHLNELLTRHGRRSGERGESFEDVARTVTERYIVPDLLRYCAGRVSLCVLRGVTLGAARTEFDQLVVRRRGDGDPVDVLAAVEVKRNINDLGHGFRLRQENLAWLTGAADGYNPSAYQTGHFRAGVFDREAVHTEGGETFVFTRDSFHRFRRDPVTGLVLRRLHLITRPGTLWGVSAAALGRIAFRVATDPRGESDSDDDLNELLRWCRSLAGPVEAPDVLRLYTATPRRARQVLVVRE